jgi:hypothetical protein
LKFSLNNSYLLLEHIAQPWNLDKTTQTSVMHCILSATLSPSNNTNMRTWGRSTHEHAQ